MQTFSHLLLSGPPHNLSHSLHVLTYTTQGKENHYYPFYCYSSILPQVVPQLVRQSVRQDGSSSPLAVQNTISALAMILEAAAKHSHLVEGEGDI